MSSAPCSTSGFRTKSLSHACWGAPPSRAAATTPPTRSEHRLDVYHEQSEPLVDYYSSRGLLREIHANRGVDEVSGEVEQVLSNAKQTLS